MSTFNIISQKKVSFALYNETFDYDRESELKPGRLTPMSLIGMSESKVLDSETVELDSSSLIPISSIGISESKILDGEKVEDVEESKLNLPSLTSMSSIGISESKVLEEIPKQDNKKELNLHSLFAFFMKT